MIGFQCPASFKVFVIGIVIACASAPRVQAQDLRPNIILMMADDLGWGDVGFNGNEFVKTPHLDAMAREGLQLNRFYSGSPVCSPTRASVLTGRHPHRYGITHANVGALPEDENNLAAVLKGAGYTTGHFGKWHLGTLTHEEKDANRGRPENLKDYAPPWDRSFDVCFSTESKVPTYDPMIVPEGWSGRESGSAFGTAYWVGEGKKASENLEGDDSRIIMDRALPFIEKAAAAETPFFAVVWFHAPHLPVVADEEHRALYPDLPLEGQHYYGCISALDDQVGRLRAELRRLGVARDTMIWFCSDNGPEGTTDEAKNGSSGPFRGRKRSVHEGGVRVPGLIEWPERISTPRQSDEPVSTLDILPTVLELLGLLDEDLRRMDGVSLAPLVSGETFARTTPIPFALRGRGALTGPRFKVVRPDAGKPFFLYDLLNDPAEKQDLSETNPEVFEAMRTEYLEWEASATGH